MGGIRKEKKGVFVISLDFELHWGVWDVTTKAKYGANILGVRQAIPALLDIFKMYDIKATFATVGFLFAVDKQELFNYTPDIKPAYSNKNYNVYDKEINTVGENETTDPYHFGYSLLQQIQKSNHEIGSHTFCHYYCLEDGQTEQEFDADVKSAKEIALSKGISLSSIVFPRNQVNEEYLPILYQNGITAYRGNPSSWIYKPRKYLAEVLFIRFCRLLDTYLPLSGYNTHTLKAEEGLPLNVPASRFLKPFNNSLRFLEKLKIWRIKKEMTYAAKSNTLYHLWWHPHNFGVNLQENMNNLTKILKHYELLKNKYGFQNFTMKDIVKL
jgi:peptidoglycan/xylan/chitin deacetylase (PgdA/CDA1 family)